MPESSQSPQFALAGVALRLGDLPGIISDVQRLLPTSYGLISGRCHIIAWLAWVSSGQLASQATPEAQHTACSLFSAICGDLTR